MFRKCVCILSSPLLCASRDFSSGFSAFFPLFVRLPLLVPFPSVASASSPRQPTPLPLPAPSGFLVPPFSLPPASRLGGGVVYVKFCTGIASGSYRCFFSLHCLATSVCASSCGSFFLSSCFPASGCLTVLSPDSSLLPSSSLTWPVSSAPGWGSPPMVSVVSCYLRCSAWHSVMVCCLCLLCSYWLLCGSLWLCLSAVQAFLGPLFPCGLLQGFQRPLLLLLFALLLLPPLRVSLLSLSFGWLLHRFRWLYSSAWLCSGLCSAVWDFYGSFRSPLSVSG